MPTRSQRARSVLTFFAQDSGTDNLAMLIMNQDRLPGTVRQLIVTGPGRNAPTVISTHNDQLRVRALIEHSARPTYPTTPRAVGGNRTLRYEIS